jgi:hypothetical protein
MTMAAWVIGHPVMIEVMLAVMFLACDGAGIVIHFLMQRFALFVGHRAICLGR